MLSSYRPFIVRATAQPSHRPKCRTKLNVNDVKREIEHAQNICFNFENEPACRVAWDRVEEVSSAYARQREHELYEKSVAEMCAEDPTSCREYDC
jgi:hypothetical protein